MEQIEQAEHAIGNHTHQHIKGWNTSTQNYINNIETANTILQTKLFRPPYGRITRRQIAQLKTHYRIVMWSILSRDYNAKINIDKTLKRMYKQTQAGSIIVFHDSQKAYPQLKQLLPAYLHYCQQQGFAMHVL